MFGLNKFIKKVMSDSLYKNSIFLIASTAVMSLFGFVFWIIAARLYSTSDIGIATALISVLGLLGGFSVLGFNVGLIRYLPGSKDKNRKINTAFTLVALVAIVVSAIYLMFIHNFSPDLEFIRDSLGMSLIFIVFIIFASWNTLVESVYIAFRDAKYILVKNTIFSTLKIFGLFILVSFGAFGIFSSHMVALIIGIVVVLGVLVTKHDYKPHFRISDSILKKMGSYSFGNYVAGFIASMPTLILPIIVLNYLGSHSAAYYYMAMMIANLLFVVPQATSNSLFAEGSYDQVNINKQVIKASKIISLLLIPLILIVFFFGDIILKFFGNLYVLNGFGLLKILSIGGIFVAINSVFASLLKVKKNVTTLLKINFIGTSFILIFSYFIAKQGLEKIGFAWMIGQILMNFIYFSLLLKTPNKNKNEKRI